ncbi:MAG TPA: sensor histidine kinase [Roseiarcus sp.]|nr:sensor histidine kinase [Roseiarcus sp.]
MLAFAAAGASAAEPKRVLLLHSFAKEVAPFSDFSAAFRKDLSRRSPWPIDFYEASIETARFRESEDEGPLVEYLHSLFAARKLDLIVSIGGPAARFSQRYRAQLFPSTPLLISAAEQRVIDAAALTANETAVGMSLDFPPLIANILQLLPETKNIAVVLGDAPIDRYWVEQARRLWQPFMDRVNFLWLNKSSHEDLLKQVGALPPHSAIFYGDYWVDVDGVLNEGEQVLAEIYARANSPIFSYIDSYLGRGIVGGPLLPVAAASQQAAEVAVRILGGQTPGEIKTPAVGLGTPVFDARELQRWRVSEERLPAGSRVEFREPTVWDQYKWVLLGAALFVAVEAILILVLLVNRRRLGRAIDELKASEGRMRLAQEAARDLSGRLINAQEDERARLARALHDDVTQRLAVLAIDAGRKGGEASSEEALRAMRDDLARLSEDVHALAYALHPAILEDLGLVEALRAECDRFSAREGGRAVLDAPADPVDPSPPVALCLFRIAQEALRNVARHAKANSVEVTLRRVDDGLQLAVRDDGVGFDPSRQPRRPSLGHASMRQRVFLVDGELDIESVPGGGATIVAWAPLSTEAQRAAPARVAG